MRVMFETEVTNNMVTGQGTEREQPVEEVPYKNVTVRVAELTETNATNEIRENTDSSDTEHLTEKDDERDSTDSTDNTEGAVTIDEDFSKVCSTCPSNPESEWVPYPHGNLLGEVIHPCNQVFVFPDFLHRHNVYPNLAPYFSWHRYWVQIFRPFL